jgi:AraC-like DNA-binding protein
VADTLPASVLTGYVDLARCVGLDPLRMLDAAGIPRAALTDPDRRFPAVAMRELLERSACAADDFGLRLTDLRTPSIMGLLALIAREQPTARAVLQAFNRHHALHQGVTTYPYEDAADDITIVRIVQTWTSPGPDSQSVGLAIGRLMRLLRLFLGAEWRPLGVSLVRSPPKSLDAHRRILGPRLDFNQAFDGVVCARTDLDRPNPNADPEMARQIERYVDDLGGGQAPGLPEQARGIVVSLLPTGRCKAEVVSRQLGMDLRTFQRQLAAADTGFLDILQGVRMGLLPQYLEQSDTPLADIAERLGFSALSAFSRWHRAHHGQSASDRRDAARAATGR